MSEDSLTNANNNSETSNQDYDGTMAGDASASRPVHKPRKIVSYGGAGNGKAKISYGGHALGVSNGSQKAKSYEELMGAACKVSGFADNSSSRIRRRRWWRWHLLIVGVGAIVPYAIALCTDELEHWLLYLLELEHWLLYLHWGLGISAILRLRADIARCHDLGWSGWGVLPFFVLAWIPEVNYISEFVRVIMFGCMDGQPFTNRFGPDPKGRELVPAERIRRLRWWGWHLLISGIGAIVPYAIALCTDRVERFLEYWLLYLCFWCGITAIIRIRADIARCHDLGWSGWAVLPFLVLAWIPGVNYISEFVRVIIFGCLDGQPFTNKFGPDPKGRELVPADANSQMTGGTPGGGMANIVELQHLQEELLKVEADKYATDMLKEAENHRKAMAEALAEGRLSDVLLEGSKAKKSYENAISTAKTARMAARMEPLIHNNIDSMILISEKNFLIGKYPVTQDVYEAVTGDNPSNCKGGNLPVTNVSYSDCQNFIEKLNALPEVVASGCPFRLPTEEEWVFACRAGANGDYCKLEDGTEITTHTLGDVAWFEANSGGNPHPVGQKKSNAFGLFDMLGNVWEWTASPRAFGRVSCGGGYGTRAHNFAAGVSDTTDLEARDNALGFRLARDCIGK